jgi:segregation and condensation protein B
MKLQRIIWSQAVETEREAALARPAASSDAMAVAASILADVREEPKKLSQAGLETLSIIAYHQPVTRAEIEEIRGVAVSKGTVDLLFELGWIRLRGRRRSPGRPVTYGTTDAFLDYFGLAALSDLPGLGDLKAAGLLSSRLPPDFDVPEPGRLLPGEDPLEDGEDAADFHLDFLSEDEARE